MICVNYNLIYWAERIVVSGLVAVVYSTIVFMTPIGMRDRLRRPDAAAAPRRRRARRDRRRAPVPAGAPRGRRGGSMAYGVALVLAAAFACALGNLIAVRNHGAGIPTIPGTAWTMVYGTLFAVAVALVSGAAWTFDARPAYVLSLAYLAVCGSVVAFVTYFALLKRVGAGPSSYIAIATPVIALAAVDAARRLPVDAGRRGGHGAGRARQRAGAALTWPLAREVARGPQSSPSFLITSTLSIRRVLPSVAAASTMSRFG